MPKPRVKETHPFIEELRIAAQKPSLAEYAEHLNLPRSDVYTIADGNPNNPTLRAHYRFAQAAGLDWEYYTLRYLQLADADE